MPKEELARRIERLKKERGAAILAHNYQPPEIQDIADHLGDSLDLSRLTQRIDQEVVIFCGVHFMAETAAILSPDKKIILPDPTAGCPMAEMLSENDLLSLKEAHPDAEVVMYVNSTAEVKAQTDICCTSANAVKVVEGIPDEREIIFGPDRYLGRWVQRQTERKMIIWNGFCPSHQKIIPANIEELRERYPDAVVMAHPEVHPEISRMADAVLGTGGMIRFVGESRAGTFIVGTEVGMVYRLSSLYPEKRFIAASNLAICPNMKKITLEKVVSSLENQEPVVTVPAEIADRARRSIERMIEIG
jgi:quinolinate synthase